MIFASSKSKGFAARPAASDAEALNPVEEMLREAAAWEPNCPPPDDFAAFTRCALENRARNPFPPASNRPASSVQWVRGLRAPLAASLALGLVLWVGGSVNDLNDGSVSDQTRETVRSALSEKPSAPNTASRTAEKTQTAAQPVATIATDTAQASRLPYAQTSPRATIRRHKRHGASGDNGAGRVNEALIATRGAKQAPSAPLWKTETVERPAWGALIPTTFACSTPTSNETGQETDETETTLMPVVLDVALPETANLAANTAPSSTDAPPLSTAP